MKHTQNAQATRLGDRLIAAGYINREQCDQALAHQARHGGLFGNALIQLGHLTEAQMDAFFIGGQHAWSGERMLHSGIITRPQLVAALNYQMENGGRLGNALIALGYASRESIDAFYRELPAEHTLLGERLVQEGHLTQEDLERALQFQRNSGGQLGEILLSMDLISPERLYRAIATQRNMGRVGSKLNFQNARKLPYQIALKHNAIIVNTREDEYLLAVHDVLGEAALREIRSYLDKPVEQALATMGEIESFWEMVYRYEESEDSVYKLYNEQPMNSAIITLTRAQKVVGIAILVAMCLFFILDYFTMLVAINVLLQVFYFAFTVIKVVILSRGFTRREYLKYTKEQVAAIDERELPIYTLLIPVYREAAVIERLMKHLGALDYPKHKLDIRILLEEDDPETLAVLQGMALPSYYKLIVVPDTQPHTKPKACNYGLIRARGDYVVIYDAEDIPDPDQLKKAYLAFKELPDSYVCVQSKLNYFNSSQNILTNWFTQEYSTWFDILLIGIMTLDTPIPLGGTSNHFKADFLRRIGAWDPFNVTEDADLGVRLYKLNYHTAMLDSHTWEEANSKTKNWIRQRSRWIKGYLQTWLVHMRHPRKLFRELGLKGFIGYQSMVFGTPLLPIMNPIFWALLILWYAAKPPFLMELFPGALYYVAAIQLFVSNFFFVYSNILGAYTVVRDSEEKGTMHISYSIILSGVLLPFYWVLLSIAAYKALFQLVRNPYYWEKTHHGLSEQTGLRSIFAETVSKST